MKAAFILFALAYVHIARGLPTNNMQADKPAPAKADQAAPAADQAPQAAPAAEKPDGCKVNIKGREETLKLGDRYCKDDTTSGVCSHEGQTFEYPCDSGFKCYKHKSEWKVTCLQLNVNGAIKYGEDGNGQGPVVSIEGEKQGQSGAQNDNTKPQPAPQNDNAPSNPAPANPAPSNPAPANPAPANPAPSNPAPANPAPANPAPANPAPATPAPAAPPAATEPPKPQTPEGTPKPETCKATINGQEQTLQPGDRYCLSETTNRVCNYGDFIDYECPNSSKCLKSPDKWQVLCRIVNRNQGGDNKPSPSPLH